MSLPYCRAQQDFIDRIRQKVDSEDVFFHHQDWRMIKPNTGRYCSLTRKVYAENFYIHPLAVWVPDKLLPRFVPSCPHCQSSCFVQPSKAQWIRYPKILYGLKGHRYLDTKLYPCNACRRHFAGYNPESMKIDMHLYMGYFNFHFSGRFAVEEFFHIGLLRHSNGQDP
jgi:hypothetical protein